MYYKANTHNYHYPGREIEHWNNSSTCVPLSQLQPPLLGITASLTFCVALFYILITSRILICCKNMVYFYSVYFKTHKCVTVIILLYKQYLFRFTYEFTLYIITFHSFWISEFPFNIISFCLKNNTVILLVPVYWWWILIFFFLAKMFLFKLYS